MNMVPRLSAKITAIRRQRLVGSLVKPALRSQVGPQTLGFASREPVHAILDDGTLVLYDGAVVRMDDGHVQELAPRAGYRIWERMTGSA